MIDKKIKARWLLFFFPSLVVAGCGFYIITKYPDLRGVSYILWFCASWFALLGAVVRKADKGEDPSKLGIHKLTQKEEKEVKF